ncbi:MAG: N-acetylmuramic acid 6-phosphate etherase, partial [Fidelibacterota bacterium]
RLGVLDSAECPPTFSAPPGMFNGIIAGGDRALRESIEGAEDRAEEAVKDLREGGLKKGDLVIGIATSSTTPYVLEGLKYARSVGSRTVFVICNPAPLVPVEVDVLVAIDVGREVITGSTRMKSGTATKMVLNMISTATMVRLGKVYGNLMVDVKAVSEKLLDRATRIICQLTSLSYTEAAQLLRRAHNEAKTAIVMHHKRCSYREAVNLLDASGGFLRPILEGEARGS